MVFHSDRESTYTVHDFTVLCDKLGIRQSMGRTGSCFGNAAAESFFSTLEHEVLSRHHYKTGKKRNGQCGMGSRLLQSTTSSQFCGMQSPIDYETAAANRAA